MLLLFPIFIWIPSYVRFPKSFHEFDVLMGWLTFFFSVEVETEIDQISIYILSHSN